MLTHIVLSLLVTLGCLVGFGLSWFTLDSGVSDKTPLFQKLAVNFFILLTALFYTFLALSFIIPT